MTEYTRVNLRENTLAALRNLFVILHIDGNSLDDQVYELATRAFSANSDVDKSRRTLRHRSVRGQKKARRQIEVKEETLEDLRALHGRLFPFLPWTSWDWFLKELYKIAEDSIYEPGQTVHFSGETE